MFVKGAGVIRKEHALYWLILYYFSHFTVLAHAGFGFSGVCVYIRVCVCEGRETDFGQQDHFIIFV